VRPDGGRRRACTHPGYLLPVNDERPDARGNVGADGPSDHRVLAAGTAQNVVGLVVFVVGTFAANVLVSRAFGGARAGAAALALVTIGTQFAFVAAAGTRFGMDMAAVRSVAIETGAGHGGRIRGVVSRSAAIAAAVSLAVAAVTYAFAARLGDLFSEPGQEAAVEGVIRAAALSLPFIALTFVFLGGSRGLKVMRHTLYVQWVGQPLIWIALMVVLWRVDKTASMAVYAYTLSWVCSAAAAAWFWSRVSSPFSPEPVEAGIVGKLARYGAPRAPAALLSQGLFWVDYFVAAAYQSSGKVTRDELGVYSASVRVALAMVLFLTAVSYVFSPFVADLHARGERERLDGLFKAITRWTVAGTIPFLLLMLIVPGPLLQIFGGETFSGGTAALRILLIGQAVNVSVGASGFVLIMAGRTGWDLTVYALSFPLDVVLSLVLVSAFGIEGAAVAQTITIASSNAFRLFLVWRHVGIHPYDLRYARLLVPAAGCGGMMLAVHAWLSGTPWPVDLVGTAAAGMCAYLVGVVAFALTADEKSAARALLARTRWRRP
jgi:O-antigen/teichoic acid export membrane protein